MCEWKYIGGFTSDTLPVFGLNFGLNDAKMKQ